MDSDRVGDTCRLNSVASACLTHRHGASHRHIEHLPRPAGRGDGRRLILQVAVKRIGDAAWEVSVTVLDVDVFGTRYDRIRFISRLMARHQTTMNARDPGLQLERTSAAWTRTGASLLACTALLARSSFAPFDPALLGVSIGIALGCVALFWVCGCERRLLNVNGFSPPTIEVHIASGLTVVVSAAAAFSMMR